MIMIVDNDDGIQLNHDNVDADDGLCFGAEFWPSGLKQVGLKGVHNNGDYQDS